MTQCVCHFPVLVDTVAWFLCVQIKKELETGYRCLLCVGCLSRRGTCMLRLPIRRVDA